MYKILVVDDESIEREGISFLIEKYKFPLEVAQATNGKTALEYMRTHPIDILLTDVKMPQMDGLELARHTFEKYPDVRILVFSAYGEFEFAKKAMAAQAVSYLLKPIDPEELTHAVDKAVQVVLRKQENKRMQNLLQNTQALDKQKKIALSVADKIEFVEIGSIIRCESESNYTTFYLKSGEKLIVSKTLKEFDELLAPYHFLRVHQSHLINLDEIKSFIKSDGGYIRMKDGASVSISRQRRNYVMEVLKQL